MKQNQVIDEINYYKAQAITELLYARGMITFDEYVVGKWDLSANGIDFKTMVPKI